MLNKELCIKCKKGRTIHHRPDYSPWVGWDFVDDWNWDNAHLVWCDSDFSSDVRLGPREKCHFYMEQLVSQ